MRIVGIAFVASAAVAVPAQAWQFFEPGNVGNLAFDVTTGRLLHFGDRGAGIECYAWDGASWTFVPQQGQPVRDLIAVTTDPLGGRRVALAASRRFGPLHTFVGSNTGWHEVQTPIAPEPREEAALAYDVGRNRLVLFGGSPFGPSFGPLSDTWEFDGRKWLRREFAVSPPARCSAGMIYDLARGRCVLFGGGSTSQQFGLTPGLLFDDTWEYDGVSWQRVNTPTTPPPSWPLMTYDLLSARTVMHMCQSGPTSVQPSTWEYDGATWRAVFTAQSPTDRLAGSMQFDLVRNRTVLYGGREAGFWQTPHPSEVWEYDGTNWSQRRDAPPSAPNTKIAYDHAHRRTLAFLEQSQQIQSWAHDGNRWSRLATNTPPGITAPRLVAHDDARQCTWLFAKVAGPQTCELWSLAGNVWTRATPTHAPVGRNDPAMTVDLARRRVVMFGGDNGITLADTWEFDGNDWQPRVTPTQPPGRTRTTMTYDLARGRCVIFGGMNIMASSPMDSTWEYDGVDWQHVPTAHRPPARIYHHQVYDRLRGVTVLYDGEFLGNWQKVLHDAWEYDGDWREVSARRLPLPVDGPFQGAAIAHDCDTGRMLFLDPISNAIAATEGRTAASFAAHGRGCPGSLGAPQLGTLPGALPMPGSAFPLVLSGLPSSGGVALLVLGASVLDHHGTPLPIALDALAMPGCDLWTAIDVVLPIAHGGTSHQLSLTVPTAQQLAGAVIGAQVLVLDAASPNGIAAVTNGAVICLQ